MKAPKKSIVILALCLLMSFTSFMFLHSESRQVGSFSLKASISKESVEQQAPVINQGRLVKFLFESLIKLVPAG